jgi:multicomponent Na+:H+ antiporter subunit F
VTGATILEWSTTFGLICLSLGFALTIYRIIRGPTLADRILGLDLITMLGVGFIAIVAIRTDFSLYIDIAIALALVGFLSTTAFARYLLRQSDWKRIGAGAK